MATLNLAGTFCSDPMLRAWLSWPPSEVTSLGESSDVLMGDRYRLSFFGVVNFCCIYLILFLILLINSVNSKKSFNITIIIDKILWLFPNLWVKLI